MRDVHEFTSPTYWRKDLYAWWANTWWVSSGPAYGTILSYKCQRSDPLPTSPQGGNYFLPTYYEAFFANVGLGSGEGISDLGYYDQHRYVWSGWGKNPSMHAYGCDFLLHPAVPASVVNRALAGCYSQLKGNLNVGVAAGEMRQSVGLIRDLSQEAASLFKKRSLGWRFRPLLSPKRAASEFLRIKFGIVPLMSDIYAACEIIQNGAEKPLGTVKTVVMDDSYTVPGPRYNEGVLVHRYSGSVKRGVEVGMTFSMVDPARFQLWQYGLTNPLSVAWELVTLSFVVDWFTGLGAFLDGLQQPIGLKFEHGYQTRFLRNDLVAEERPGPSNWNWTGPWYTANYRTRAMERLPLAGFTGPNPYLDLGLNTSQALTSLALITARAKK